jgi:hypothetical protein
MPKTPRSPGPCWAANSEARLGAEKPGEARGAWRISATGASTIALFPELLAQAAKSLERTIFASESATPLAVNNHEAKSLVPRASRRLGGLRVLRLGQSPAFPGRPTDQEYLKPLRLVGSHDLSAAMAWRLPCLAVAQHRTKTAGKVSGSPSLVGVGGRGAEAGGAAAGEEDCHEHGEAGEHDGGSGGNVEVVAEVHAAEPAGRPDA